MVITRELVNPSPIENTTVCKLFGDGVHRRYEITPTDDYVLHDNVMDWTEMDEETGEEVLVLGYSVGMCSCAATYDFTANQREFCAVLADSVLKRY